MKDEKNEEDALDEIRIIEMRLLAELWRTQSLALTAAALRVNISKASRMLASLREAFEDPLFQRYGSKMVPTARMKSLEPRLKSVLLGLRELTQTPLGFHLDETEATISIAATDNANIALVSPFIGRIASLAPKLRVRIEPLSGRALDLLRAGELDFILGQDNWSKRDPQFRAQQITESPHVVVVRRHHPLVSMQQGGIVTADMLAQFPEISTIIERPSGVRTGIVLLQKIPSRRIFETPYFAAALAAIPRSDAFCVVPEVLLRCFEGLADVVSLRSLEAEASPWRPNIVWHERTEQSLLHVWFRSSLLAFNSHSHDSSNM